MVTRVGRSGVDVPFRPDAGGASGIVWDGDTVIDLRVGGALQDWRDAATGSFDEPAWSERKGPT